MKTYLRIIRFIRPYKGKVVSYALFTLLAVAFSTLALYMLWPVLDLLFNPENYVGVSDNPPPFSFSMSFIREWVQYHAALLAVHHGQTAALFYVTMAVVTFNLLGNTFKFLSTRFLGTIRTKVVEDLRKNVYDKLILKEVAYLENSRKGDVVSRVTSDIQEVEYSVVITFESIIRDPLGIIFALGAMIAISWQLTLFIFI